MKKENFFLNTEKYMELADFYKMFGDATRLKILMLLMKGETMVTEISERINMNQSAVSHQLRILKQSRIIKVRRDGKNSFYSFDDDHIYEILRTGFNHINETRD